MVEALSEPCHLVRLCCSEHDPCHRRLQVRCRDQVGFLFKLSELLTVHGIDVEKAVISTTDGNVDNEFWLRAARLSDFNDINSLCQELERTISSDYRTAPFHSDSTRNVSTEPLANVSKKLGINADLLSVESFRELASRRPSDVTQSLSVRSATQSQFRYALQLKGINQTGLLAYASLVFVRCGFRIANAEIRTSDGHIKDRFELEADEENAARMLHTHLHIPMLSDSFACLPWGCRRLGSFCQDQGNARNLEAFATSSMLAFAANQEGCEHERLEYGNGDVFEGSCRSNDSTKMRDGFGTYHYRSGDQYKGQWQQDKKDGHGIFLYRDEGVYVGQWSENQKHGLGVQFEVVDGGDTLWYQGEWEKDKKYGLGVEERGHILLAGNFREAREENIRGHSIGRNVQTIDVNYGLQCGIKIEKGVKGVSVLHDSEWKPLLGILGNCAQSGFCSSESRLATSMPTFGNYSISKGESSPQSRSSPSGLDSASLSRGLSTQLDMFHTASISSQTSRHFSRAASYETPWSPGGPILTGQRSLTPPPTQAVEVVRSRSRAATRSLSPDLRAPDLQAIKCPMLWGSAELSVFMQCLGMPIAVVDGVRSFHLRGAAHLLDLVADPEKSEDVGFTSPLQRLLVRRGLQRLLEHDRWENSAQERAGRDVLKDTVLSAYVVPWDELEVTSKIAEGTFGTIHRAKFTPSVDRFGLKAGVQHTVAVKAIISNDGDVIRDDTTLYEFLKEARVIASLSHENICKFLGICAGPQQSQRYIIIELLRCSLFELVHSKSKASCLTTSVVISLSIGISAGVVYLHGRQVVHADLKSLNILIGTSGEALVPRICDFGHAAVRATPSPHSRLCTWHWAAPEVLRYESLGPGADVFSCGVIVWEMLTRSTPHPGYSPSQIQACVGWAGLIPELDMLQGYPQRLQWILWRCFQFLPKQRPSARQLHRYLAKLSDAVVLDAMRDVEDFFCTAGGMCDVESRSPRG